MEDEFDDMIEFFAIDDENSKNAQKDYFVLDDYNFDNNNCDF